jgi:hypothetical protein
MDFEDGTHKTLHDIVRAAGSQVASYFFKDSSIFAINLIVRRSNKLALRNELTFSIS